MPHSYSNLAYCQCNFCTDLPIITAIPSHPCCSAKCTDKYGCIICTVVAMNNSIITSPYLFGISQSADAVCVHLTFICQFLSCLSYPSKNMTFPVGAYRLPFPELDCTFSKKILERKQYLLVYLSLMQLNGKQEQHKIFPWYTKKRQVDSHICISCIFTQQYWSSLILSATS